MWKKLELLMLDFIYSVFGIVTYNVILQFIVNPYLNKELGNEMFGSVLSLIAFILLFAGTFGSGCNYSRMLVKKDIENIEGDYFYFLFYSCCLSGFFIVIYNCLFISCKCDNILFTLILCIFTILRFYLDVFFRLKKDYKRFGVYYVLLGIGYFFGILIYQVIKIWQIVFIIGEFFAITYSILRINKKLSFKKSEQYLCHIKSTTILSISDFMSNGILQIDRILLGIFSEGRAVTIFYVATLCGKILSLISFPLNGIIIGYSTNLKRNPKKIMILYFSLIMTMVTFLFMGVGLIISNILLPILYFDLYDSVKSIIFVATLGQAFYFTSSICETAYLKFLKEKKTLIINTISLILLIFLSITFRDYSYKGMAYALLLVNVIRFIALNVLGYIYVYKES